MNLLLVAINAKYIHSNLAVYSLKASAGEYEPLVELAEYTINQRPDEIFRRICQKEPDLLFFSCYIWNRSIVCEVAENIGRVFPKAVIWAGGPEVSYDSAAFLTENPAFTGVMRGEGERTFGRLLRYYIGREGTLEEISGITWRNAPAGENPGGQERPPILENGPAPLLPTLDLLPFVYQNPETFTHKIIYYESSRGCPFSCSYCLSSIDKRVRFRNTRQVKKELAFFLEHRVPQVKFVDRTFNCNHAHALEIWRFLNEHDNRVTNFHFEIEADLLTEEELDVLASMRPGLVQLEIGVQTVNKETLQAIRRTADFEKIAERVRRLASPANIHLHLDLIAGLPLEDYQSFQHSFDEVYRLKPQELQLGFLKVLRGSRMQEEAEKYGIIYRSRPPYEVLATRWMSWKELLRLKEIEEVLEIFYNSMQFRCTVAYLESYFSHPFALYEALADAYAKVQEEACSLSRMQRFEFLRAFAWKLTDGGADAKRRRALANELLTMDYYLRENGKTRPLWAQDLTPWKERILAFYQKEEQERKLLPGYTQMNWKQLMRQTHLEHFTMLQSDGRPSGRETDRWLLFDYSSRDPLTGDAKVLDVSVPSD